MVDPVRWRLLGLELAFDPDDLPLRPSEAGLAALAGDLRAVDAERLLRHFPREPDGRWPLGETVLLARVALVEPPRAPNQAWLVAESPARRSQPQVITLALREETARNFQHRWDEARWLWDRRAAGTPERERWGVAGLPLEDLAPDRGAATLVRLAKQRTRTDGERAALAILLVQAGRWREALALHDATHALDELPYGSCNHGAGIAPEVWDAAREAGMRALAPWRLGAALARIDKPADGRLFTLPGQKTIRKYGVFLEEREGRPHLGVRCEGSNARLAELWFRWPPDLAAIVAGAQPAGPSAAARRTAPTSRTEDELLAELAAHPDDEGPRRVWADLLVEREDPRGELVTLQLAPRLDARGKRRLRELERTWHTWLGSLARLVEQPRFERGFLVRCTLGSARTPFDAWSIAGTPRGLAELAGVRELELGDAFPAELAVELLGRLARLDVLVVGPAQLALAPRVRALGVRVAYGPVDLAPVFAELARRAHVPEELRLVADTVATQTRVLRAVLPALDAVPPAIARVVVGHAHSAVTASRDATRRLSVLDVVAGGARANRVLSPVAAALRDCAPGAITRITVRGTPNARTLQELRAETQRLGGIELEVVSPGADRS